MHYSTILVHLDFDAPPGARLRYAADLAADLDAHLIGFAANCIRPVHITEMGSATDETYHEQIRKQNLKRFAELELEFFSIGGDGPNSAWRQSEDLPTDALLLHARCANLIISGTGTAGKFPDHYRSVDPAELVCGAGRPVLFVAENAKFRHPEKALIGWKDTAEARRAVMLALPYLRLARDVAVLAIRESERDTPEEGLKDVVRFLVRQGIDADPLLVDNAKGPSALLDAAGKHGADLLVTGAYGRSRMRERIFGGFTRTLLAEHGLNRLMAG
jgi:nucleotide-binding universal stress UspA family protein